MSAGLAALRPRDDSASAITAALAAVDAERRAADRKLAELRAARDDALADPARTVRQITALETAAAETVVTIERLAALRPRLEERLAEARQAERLANLDRQNGEAEAACAAFRKALDETYDAAARQIISICQLGRAAEAAVRQAMATGRQLGAASRFDLPGVAGRMSFADAVVLPAMREGGACWGVLPPPVPVIRY